MISTTLLATAAIITSCTVIERTPEYQFTRTYYLTRPLFEDVYITKEFSVSAMGERPPSAACTAAVTKEPNLITGDALTPYCNLLAQVREEALVRNKKQDEECLKQYESTH